MNDSTLVMINGEASYDVPWEFNKNKHISKVNSTTSYSSKKPFTPQSISASATNEVKKSAPQLATSANTANCTCHRLPSDSNGSSKTDLHHGTKSGTPPCGVKARELKSKHQLVAQTAEPANRKREPANHKSENYIVWRYRGPDTDGRPASEYDTPWDMTCRQQLHGQDLNMISSHSSNHNQPISIQHGGGGKIPNENQQSADSGVYDEPWDRAQPLRRSNLVAKQQQQRFPPLPSNCSNGKTIESRCADEQGSTSSCNPSPCTSSRSTSSRDSAGGVDGGRLATAARSTTVMETVFCAGKNSHVTAATVAAAAAENHRIQEVRDRLIQHLCSSSTLEMNKLNHPIAATPPKPAFRRSKAKSSPDDLFNAPKEAKNNTSNISSIATSMKTDLKLCSNNMLSSEIAEIRHSNPGESDSKNNSVITTNAEVYDIPWEFTSGSSKLQAQITKHRLVEQCSGEQEEQEQQPPRNATTANENSGVGFSVFKKPTNFSRQNLRLNFGCAGLNPESEKVDANLSLDQQTWYHGNVTRAEAEQRLRGCKEGSYLVRVCESAQSQKHEEYALSLKSAKGYMHMKIQLNGDRKWILGYFSHPFDSISKMIRYYSVNKLPIKGAEHMCLLQPIADQVL